MTAERLFDAEKTPKRKGTTKALVPTDEARCPWCSSTLEQRTTDEPVLFRHGGYGATRRTIVDHCTGDQGWADDYGSRCRFKIVRSVQEVNPR